MPGSIPPSCAPTGMRAGARIKGAAPKPSDAAKAGCVPRIHATVDALGNPRGFDRTEGRACDPDGADVLLSQCEAGTVIADKGYDADRRVLK